MDFTLRDEGDRYPFVATGFEGDQNGPNELIFSRGEAELLRDRLNFLIHEYDEQYTSYVQVSFNRDASSAGQWYTYRDPSGELTVGDYVLVPTQLGGSDVLATVRSLEKGSWTGQISDVTARLERRDL